MTDDVSEFERLARAERLFSERACPVLARIAQQVEAACNISIGGLQVTFQPADPDAARGDDPICVVVIADVRRGIADAAHTRTELQHMLAKNSRLFRRVGRAAKL